MRIKEKEVAIKDIPKKAARRLLHMPLDSYKDLRSAYYLRKISRKKHNADEPIRVAFIVQMPEIWDKEEPVYQAIVQNPRFEVKMIVVPPYDLIERRINTEYKDDNFFLRKYPDTIRAYKEGNWIKLGEEYEYVFFQRPYDHYLPVTLRSSNMVKYVKCCYIPYATPEIKRTAVYPRTFFRNIYLGFMESEYGAKRNRKQFRRNVAKGRQNFLNVGYPAFEECIRIEGKPRYKTFLWTPRWTYLPNSKDGSHFFDYKDQLINHDWRDCKLIIRPHPMMWDNFISKKLLNAEDIKRIKNTWFEHGIEEDVNKSIEETFQQTDVLISDNSSVIPMFFLTGRPIILCPGSNTDYSEIFYRVIQGAYIANSWEELEKYIDMLMSKEDPLKETRRRIIEESFSQNYCATENIVNVLLQDSGLS